LWNLWSLQGYLFPSLSALCPSAGLPKAVVSLEPPWNNVLREDSVTLKCQGAHTPEDNPTQWFHNGSPIPTQVQPSYSFKAQENDSGDYRCQTGQTSLSDPVHLDVISWSVEEDWLLLQTPRLVFQEGEPIHLRCHSLQNRPLLSITFYQNGKSLTFFHNTSTSTFSILQANRNHSGKYHCSGTIERMQHSSQNPKSPSPATVFFFLHWFQIAFCLVMGLLFAVDTGLYVSVQRDLPRSVGDGKNCNVRWSQSPENK
uniref:Ig-like domain-containing protein n=1 Tax=Equus asinus TaxID=9793 RepID=A0A8C4MAS2_EQUAS